MRIDEDYYAILGLTRGASADDIRAAFRSAAKKAHPDRGGSSEAFRLVRKAADILLAELHTKAPAGRDPTYRAGDRTSLDGDWTTVSDELRAKWGLSFEPAMVLAPRKIGLTPFATANSLNAPAYRWLVKTIGPRGDGWDFHVADSLTRIFFRRSDDARQFKLRFF
ncbi:MAG TPA: J domain-containing protein [Caulobacteraceae bacterium]